MPTKLTHGVWKRQQITKIEFYTPAFNSELHTFDTLFRVIYIFHLANETELKENHISQSYYTLQMEYMARKSIAEEARNDFNQWNNENIKHNDEHDEHDEN